MRPRYVPRARTRSAFSKGGFSPDFSRVFGRGRGRGWWGCCLRRFRLALSAAANFSGGIFAIRTALYLGLILTL